MPFPTLGFHSKSVAFVVMLMLMTLWLALHGYHGLTGDGQIYAFQAFARLKPHLASDLYLQNTSQDQFTLFSPFYAWFISLIGIEPAARLLTLVFTLWLLVATWNLARAATNQHCAWLAVAFLLIIGGDFGASRAFQILDPFLTARLPSEALTITALACHIRGKKLLGILLALAALLIHPLMALPGLLMLACLWVPRLGFVGASLGVLASLATSVVAIRLPPNSHWVTIMDAPWVEVVQERSQFLFLQLWSIRDWCINAMPLLSLGFTAMALGDERIPRLCAAAALVGSAGLAVALIGGVIGPVAILVQGQAWRWVWISVLISAALVPATIMQVWRGEKCGKICAVLLVSGWIMPAADGISCVATAVVLWRARERINPYLTSLVEWTAAATLTFMALLTVTNYVTIAMRPTVPSGTALWWAMQPEQKYALRILATLLTAIVFYGIWHWRTTWMTGIVASLLLVCSIVLAPLAFKQSRFIASTIDIQEFADWERVIPKTSTVYVTPPRDVGAFVWFTLSRPNYLALDQSAGVVFSRQTAIEIRRRSEVLLPLADPDWKVLTGLRSKSDGVSKSTRRTSISLTPKSLAQVCADPLLGFVISPINVGFDPLNHQHASIWNNWNLYDCMKVRSVSSAT